MKNVTLNSKITEAYKTGLIDAKTSNSLLRSGRRYLKDCLDITKNNYDEIIGFGAGCFNKLLHALSVAELNSFDYKEIFFKALTNGFYFKYNNEIFYLAPNTFDVHYYITESNVLDCGFSFGGVKNKYHYVYLNKHDYNDRWSLNKEF